jgi:hypothetical protein
MMTDCFQTGWRNLNNERLTLLVFSLETEVGVAHRSFRISESVSISRSFIYVRSEYV